MGNFTEEDRDNFFLMVNSLKKCQRADLSDINNDENIIERLYVDPLENNLVLKSCLAPNTTLLIGRKGTGKSTIIARLQHEIRKSNDRLSLYIDVKTIFDESKSPDFDSSQYLNVLHGKELERYLLFKTFLKKIIEDIKREVKTNTLKFYLARISKVFGHDKNSFNEELDKIFENINNRAYEDILIIKEKQMFSAKSQDKTQDQSCEFTTGVNISMYDASLGVDNNRGFSEKIQSGEEIKAKFSEILLQFFDPKSILTQIKNLLSKIGIKYVFICLDDFSEIDKDAMEIFVDTIVAPLNNWSEGYFRFKIAAYPARVYLGDIDPSKIDQIKLDYYDLYLSHNVRDIEQEAILNISRLLSSRFNYFLGRDPARFFDLSKNNIFDYYKLLFDTTSNVPRNVGWILWYANQFSISKDSLITIKDLELAAEKYYIDSIEVFFSQNKYMKESFDEKLEKYHLNELLNQIIELSKKNKTEIGNSDSRIFESEKSRPVTSHFYVKKEMEKLLNTLELNFFITKYNEQKDKNGKLIVFFFLHYGLCKKEDIYFGRGNDRKYIVQRRFDYSDVIKECIDAAKKIKCNICSSSYSIDRLNTLELYDMLCPQCRKGTCEIVPVDVEVPTVKQEIQLMEFDLKLLNSLRIDEPQFASLLAQDLDCHYQKVTKRAQFLEAEHALIMRKKEILYKEYGERTYYYLTDKARNLYFSNFISQSIEVN
ncbi:hypothetical protein [Methanosarcina sp.]|uniref:hypothetical protein n=1 Tax=Methanosarcina sp. TaxID=2213 RepID=UPI003BB55842